MGRKTAAVAALIGLWILPAHAQSRAGARAAAIHSAVSARPVRKIPSPIRPVPTPAPVVTPNSGLPETYFYAGTLQDLFGYPVPGLGFDYSNLAAINASLGVRAMIDPATQYEIAQALRLRRATAGASPFFYSPFGATPIVMETPMAAQADPAPQPPIIVVVPPAEQQPPADPPVAEEQPLPDPGEFVLVQRDGRLLFAVGFTAEPGHVVYVTKEGLRRSIALDQIDVDATLRMNEERGSSIQLPKV